MDAGGSRGDARDGARGRRPGRRGDPRRADRSQPSRRLVPDLVRMSLRSAGSSAGSPPPTRTRKRTRSEEGPSSSASSAPPAEDPPSPAAPPPAPERSRRPRASRAGHRPSSAARDRQPRPRRLPRGGRGNRQDAGPGRPVLRRRSTPTASSRSGSSRSPSPRRRRRRCAVASGSSSAGGPRPPATRLAGAAAGGRPGRRVGPDHDDPRILPAPARHPPGGGRPRSAVPGPRRRRGLADREILLRRDARGAGRRRRCGRVDRGRLPQPARLDRPRRPLRPPQPRGQSSRRCRSIRRRARSTAARSPPTPAEADEIARGYEALRRLLVEFGSRFDRARPSRSAVDFDDLQLLALELLRSNESIAEAQRTRFDHLLVDEFQDTSPIQLELVRALAGPETRTFTVGDAAQSIYAFRGSRPRQLPARAGPRSPPARAAGTRRCWG